MRSTYCAASVRSCIAATRVSSDSARSVSRSSSACCWWPMSSAAVGSSRIDDARLLSECARDDGPLLLAARERAEPAVGEREQVEPPERARRRLEVRAALAGERAEVGCAPEQHVLGDGHPRRRRGLLRDDGDQAGQLPPPHRRPRSSEHRDRPRRTGRARRSRAAASSCPRRSARSARPTAPRRSSRSTSLTTARPPSRHRHAAELDRAHDAPALVVRSTSAKNGAPKNAVTIPIGISAGASAVRAITSASTKKPAPPSTDSGSSAR